MGLKRFSGQLQYSVRYILNRITINMNSDFYGEIPIVSVPLDDRSKLGAQVFTMKPLFIQRLSCEFAILLNIVPSSKDKQF